MKKATRILLNTLIAVLICSIAVSCSPSSVSDPEITSKSDEAVDLPEDTYESPLKKYVPYYPVEAKDKVTSLTESGVFKELDKFSYVLEEAPDPEKDVVTISFLNKQYTGVYNQYEYQSKTTRGRNQYEYRYTTDSGDYFILNEQGKLVKWKSSKIGRDCIPGNKEDAVSLDEAISKCEELLPTEFTETFADYKVEVSANPATDPECNQFAFAFVSYWNGIKTSQRVAFTVGMNGELLSYASTNLGRFNNKEIPSDFSPEVINNIVADVFAKENSKYEIEKTHIVLELDGTLACSVRLKLYDNGEYLTDLSILIPLE